LASYTSETIESDHARRFVYGYFVQTGSCVTQDIINGVCCHPYEKRREQQKGRPNVYVCAAQEN